MEQGRLEYKLRPNWVSNESCQYYKRGSLCMDCDGFLIRSFDFCCASYQDVGFMGTHCDGLARFLKWMWTVGECCCQFSSQRPLSSFLPRKSNFPLDWWRWGSWKCKANTWLAACIRMHCEAPACVATSYFSTVVESIFWSCEGI